MAYRPAISPPALSWRSFAAPWTRSPCFRPLSLQTAIASEIAGQIKVQLTSHERARLASARSVNPEAHDAYLSGRYFFNRPSDDNLHKAIVQFEQSVALDSTFAAGWSGLSDAYLWAGYNEGFLTATDGKRKSKQAAMRAVQLDSLSASD